VKRVLFVDDEASVLRELDRVLRPLRDRWEMTFVQSGAEALAAISEGKVEVVAADMGMPEMSGGDLLCEVRKSHPEIVRMMMVAEADRADAARSQGEAHQVVPKPCSQVVLASSVARACALHSLLSDPKLVRLASKLGTLPSVPSLYFEILDEMKNPSSTVESIGDIVAKDIGMTAKVLQMVNSAFFGLSQNITGPGQAATFLGLDTLKSLVLSLHTFSQFDGGQLHSFSITDVWEHSMKTANFARAIMEAEHANKRACEEAFLAGMMHDAGKMILACNEPGRYEAAQVLAERDGTDSAALERRVFGASHENIGAYVLGLWGLPAGVVEAVAFHHSPSTWADHSFSPLCAVHVANALSRLDLDDPEATLEGVDEGYLQRLGLDGRLPSWVEACRKLQAEISA
jgi:HD-like signal output (HDOD) protein/CheY-like chemotaxis protein